MSIGIYQDTNYFIYLFITFFIFYFLWAPLGCPSGENGLSQWPRPELLVKPAVSDHLSLTLRVVTYGRFHCNLIPIKI